MSSLTCILCNRSTHEAQTVMNSDGTNAIVCPRCSPKFSEQDFDEAFEGLTVSEFGYDEISRMFR